MPDEYFFRGTIPQYWHLVYTQYQKLFKTLAREPFEVTSFNLPSQLLAEYKPLNSDPVLLSFWNIGHTCEISVDAEYSPDRHMVQVMVFFQGPFTEEGESALKVWKAVKRALNKNGKLIDMAGHRKRSENHSRKSNSPQSRTIDAINKLIEIRDSAIRNSGKIPNKVIAMKDAPISYKTLKKYAPQLFDSWDDKNYKHEKLE